MFERESLEQMLKPNENNLNLFWNERRLIILALILTNFKVSEAWLLNAPNISLIGYNQIIYAKGIKVRELKKEYRRNKLDLKNYIR